MKQRKILYKSLFIIIFITIIVYTVILLFFKRPYEWTYRNAVKKVSSPDIYDIQEIESLNRSIDYSLQYLNQKDQQTIIYYGKDNFTIKHLIESLIDFKSKLKKHGLTETFFLYVKQNFNFYKSSIKNVLFTGYYEAHLNGSLKKTETYRYPLYKVPDDLYKIDLSQFHFYHRYKKLPKKIIGRLSRNNTITPYYTREEIDFQQKLHGKNLELVWIDNIIDVFFLQIQGSGIVQLDTGDILRVNYVDRNGHPYRAIGRLLIDQKILSYEDLSMQSIREYLKKHPEKVKETLNYNPSYIFFRIVEEGPIGALQVPLTPYRSIATDISLFPKGSLCYVKTELPIFDKEKAIQKWEKFSSFVLNQDTGGAIKGPGKVDLFTGHGEKSELVAGHMKQNGTLYFLIKKRD